MLKNIKRQLRLACIVALVGSQPASGQSDTAGTPTVGVAPIIELPISQGGELRVVDLNAVQDGLDGQAGTLATAFVAGLVPRDAGQFRDGQLRLEGERPRATATLVADPDNLPSVLTLSVRSSAFLLPDRSHLEVFINDRSLGRLRLENIARAGQASFDIPPGSLRAGANEVRFEGQQFNRVYCGAGAHFDLWTEIDLSQSGVEFASVGPTVSPEFFLGAIGRMIAAQDAVPVISPTGWTPETGQFAVALANRLGQALGQGAIAFDALTDPADANPSLVRITLTGDSQQPTRFQLAEDGTIDLLLHRGSDGLAALEGHFTALEAPVPAAPLELGTRMPLAAVGMTDLSVETHFWIEDIAFSLPNDWRVNAARRAELMLDYQYAAGLPETGALWVAVNGETVRMLPFSQIGGRIEDNLPVRFYANLLKPGRNVLSFYAQRPGMPADAPCARDLSPYLSISATSTLEVPNSPRIVLGGLAGLSDTISAQALEISTSYAVEPQLRTMVPVASLLPETGVGDFVGAQPPRLVSVPLEQLSVIPTGTFALRLDAVTAALSAEPSDATTRAARLAQAERPVTWLDRIFGSATIGEPSLIEATRDWFLSVTFADPEREFRSWVAQHTGIALLVQLDPRTPETTYLVTRPDADPADLAAALRSITTGDRPLDGHVALLSEDLEWFTWTDRSRTPVLQEPVTLSNIHGVGAVWTTARPLQFAGLLLLLVAISGLFAWRALNGGKR